MPKISLKITFAFFGVLIAFAGALRCVHMFFYTDADTGFIKQGAVKSMLLLYAVCFLMLVMCAAFAGKADITNPFEKRKSRLVFYSAVFAGGAMFYDFVHQCINCYKHITESAVQINYLIPVCLTAASAVMCAVYFIIMGISYKTDRYDFRYFKYYHLMPFLWLLFQAFGVLARYNDGIYAEESIVYYLTVIFGMLFFVSFLFCLDGDNKKLKAFLFFGFSYGMLSLVLSVPRIAASLFAADINKVDFSAVTYLFVGCLSASLCVAALKKNKSEEG